MDRLKVAFFSSLQRSTLPDVCVQCHSRTTGGYTATTNEGYQLGFCSPQCSHAYWDEYARFSQSPSTLYNTQQGTGGGVPSSSGGGRGTQAVTQGILFVTQRRTGLPNSPQSNSGARLCRLPGCTKPCYVERGRVHDYCSYSHASEDARSRRTVEIIIAASVIFFLFIVLWSFLL